MHKGLKFIFWNVRSLFNKIDSLICELPNLAPDVLNISESWLQNELPDHLVSIPNYSLIRLDRSTTHGDSSIKRGVGLCTYIKQGLNFEIECDLETCTKDIELSVIRYNLPCTGGIYVLNVYRPPMGDMEKCIDYLQTCINTIRNNEIDIFIGGDFNVDVKRQNSPQFSKLSRFMRLNQLKQYIKETTRPDSDSIIDLQESGVIHVNISDHLPIFLIRKKS